MYRTAGRAAWRAAWRIPSVTWLADLAKWLGCGPRGPISRGGSGGVRGFNPPRTTQLIVN